jgi:hypothetical protein
MAPSRLQSADRLRLLRRSLRTEHLPNRAEQHGGLRLESHLCSANTNRVACLPTSDAITTGTVSSPHVLSTALALLADLLRLLRLMFRSRTQLAAENLFLRKQLACYIERQVRPRRTDNAARITLVLLSQFVEWRELMTIIRPETLVRWHHLQQEDLSRAVGRNSVSGRPRHECTAPATLPSLLALISPRCLSHLSPRRTRG